MVIQTMKVCYVNPTKYLIVNYLFVNYLFDIFSILRYCIIVLIVSIVKLMMRRELYHRYSIPKKNNLLFIR